MRIVLSVIVPVYNCERYVERCVNSILTQTFSNFELILVNDGSTDLSGDICEKTAYKDNRVSVIHQSNFGVSAARNSGLNIAKGDYIMFVDSDDELPINAVEKLINANTNQMYDMIVGDMRLIGDALRYNYLSIDFAEYNKYSLVMDMMLVEQVQWLMSTVTGKLFNSDIIRKYGLKFHVKLANGEDGDFLIDYLSHCARAIGNIKVPVYIAYRYAKSERISAVSAFYFDFIEFYFMHAMKMFRILGSDIPADREDCVFHHFINGLITYLVCAMAYEDYYDKQRFKSVLRKIIENEMVRKSAKKYHRSDRTHSWLIPLSLKLHSEKLLYFSLKMRTRVYWQTHQKASIIKSIYRE